MIRRVSKQKGLQLYPRVILNKSAPKMRLNMSEKQRHTLLTTMLSALIKEERIKTTTAKAKFIQFYADRVDFLFLLKFTLYSLGYSAGKEPDRRKLQFG